MRYQRATDLVRRIRRDGGIPKHLIHRKKEVTLANIVEYITKKYQSDAAQATEAVKILIKK